MTDNRVGMWHDEMRPKLVTRTGEPRALIAKLFRGRSSASRSHAARHGSLTIGSTPGVGTIVTIVLPRDRKSDNESTPC